MCCCLRSSVLPRSYSETEGRRKKGVWRQGHAELSNTCICTLWDEETFCHCKGPGMCHQDRCHQRHNSHYISSKQHPLDWGHLEVLTRKTRDVPDVRLNQGNGVWKERILCDTTNPSHILLETKLQPAA